MPVEGGRDTAANIAGAELIEIPGMGHDLPAVLYSRIADAIESVAERARRYVVKLRGVRNEGPNGEAASLHSGAV